MVAVISYFQGGTINIFADCRLEETENTQTRLFMHPPTLDFYI